VARKPTDEVAPKPRPVSTVEQRVAQPGDRICGSCGEANDPSRKFCRRCGANIVEAKVVAAAAVPWYRRLFRRDAASKQYAAGERKSSMQKAAPKEGGLRGILKGIGLVRGLLAVVVAIGIFGYVGIPSFQSLVNSALNPILQGGPTQIIDNIRQLVAPESARVTPIPDDVTATSETEGHEAPQLADGYYNTDWQGTDKAPVITVDFEVPIDLTYVIVRTGNYDAFADFQRPVELTLEFPDGTTETLTLSDTRDPQTLEVAKDDLESVMVRIGDTRGPEDAPISISEIEFWAKKPAGS
jgi:hypothetical protein